MKKRWLTLLLLLPFIAGAVQGAETASGAATFTLTGTVTDPAGRPMAGISLWAVALAEQRWRELPPSSVSGPDGSFSIPDLPRGRIDLHACGDGYLPALRRVGVTDGPIRLELEPGAMIRGRVLDVDGAPFAGARVSMVEWVRHEAELIRPWSPCRPSRSVESEADGRFEIGPLDGGEYDLVAKAPGSDLVQEATLHLSIDSAAEIHDIELRMKRQETPVDLVLEERDARWKTLRGRVTEPDGTPVADAAIALVRGDAKARSAADGRFEMSFLPQEAGELVVHKEGYSLTVLHVDPENLPDGEIVIHLETGALVTGRLLGLTPADRSPDMWLTLRGVGSLGPEASVQADDTFRFENIPAGTWTLTFHGESRSVTRELVVPPGQTEVTVEFSLPPFLTGRVLDPGGSPLPQVRPLVTGAAQGAEKTGGVTPFTLTGTVTDLEGRPLAGLSLWAVALAEQKGRCGLPASAVSGPDGSFSIPGLPRGQVDLHACGRGYLPVRESVWFTDGPVRLELPPGMMIRGRVLDGDGAPVTGARLSVSESIDLEPGEHPPIPAWSPCPPSGEAEAGADGRYEIGPFAPGRYDLQVELAGFELAPGEPRHLWITDEVPVDLFDLRVKRREGRKGSLTDSAGEPVWWASIALSPETGEPALYRSAFDGSFYFLADPGRVTFRVEQEGYEAFEQTIEISEKDTPIELVLERDASWKTLRGRVTEPDGAPIADATLLLPGDIEARSAADGSFEIQLLLRENEEVLIFKEGFSSALVRLDPKSPPVGEITIRLETGARVTGHLLGLTPGDRGPHARLILKRSGYPDLQASVQADDTFRFENVPAGLWKLAFQGAYRSAYRMLLVKPGQAQVAVDLALPPPIPLSGRVLEDKGRPIAGAEVVAYEDSGRDRIDVTFTRDDGSFDVRVPKGEVQLAAFRTGFLNGRLNVSVAGQGVKGVEIRLEREK